LTKWQYLPYLTMISSIRETLPVCQLCCELKWIVTMSSYLEIDQLS